MATSGGDLGPSGELTVKRIKNADLQAAIEAEQSTTAFKSAWFTAVQDADGKVTTTAHATAGYSHRGEPRECHVSFEVEGDEAVERAFAKLLKANGAELVKQAMADARLCSVAAQNNTDIIGKAGNE